jgi:hypothetical protein
MRRMASTAFRKMSNFALVRSRPNGILILCKASADRFQIGGTPLSGNSAP